MTVTFEIPEDVAFRLAPYTDLSRSALESIALEGYRSRRISEAHMMRLLGFESRFDVRDWLTEHDMPLNYGIEDLRDDLLTIERLNQVSVCPMYV